MVDRVWLDIETYSAIKLKKSGVYRYAEDAEIIIVGYAFDDETAQVHDLTLSPLLPEPLVQALRECTEVWAHNSTFDRVVWNNFFKDKYVIPLEKWHDTMVQSYEHGLPGALSALCSALGMPVDQSKNVEDGKLVHLFCKPLGKNRKLDRASRETHPKEWAKFMEYCRQDVEAMRGAQKRMPNINYPANPNEVKFFHLDQRMNDRGVYIDLHLVEAMLAALEKEKDRLKAAIDEETDGYVKAATQRDKLLEYIFLNYGIHFDTLDKAMVYRELNNLDLSPEIRTLLEIRQESCKTSTAKYQAIVNAVCSDDRVHGMFQFRGATKTGRCAARLIQLQNLPSRNVPDHQYIDGFIEFTKAGKADYYDAKVMDMASYTLRGTLIPAPGYKYLVSDWSNIEGRLACWFAGEDWKIQAFKDFDAGNGPDLYNLAYAKSFKIPVEKVNKQQRQIGKCQELALGYGGGAGAFSIFAAGYNVDLSSLASQLGGVPEELLEKADWMWEYATKRNATHGLPREIFKACDVIKQVWRLAHPAIFNFWKALEEGMATCYQAFVDNRDIPPIQIGRHIRMKMMRHMNRLVVRLPSGRCLNYNFFEHDASLKSFTYMGTHPVAKRWTRLHVFGGHMLENICQATSSEILNFTMLECEKSDLPPVIQVHDEVVCEVTKDRSIEELDAIMVKGFDWTNDLPLAASGFETLRYRK